MASPTYERLSAQDSSYIMFEGRHTRIHVIAIAVFDTGTLTGSGGGLEMERIRAHVESRLHLIPRYRQRLAYTPVQRHPIWVDDERFDVRYHVRGAGLPRPGDLPQLKDFAGTIASQPLDRGRPLWELWCVDGLEGGRFAVIAKVHHCMVDGVSGVGVLTALLSGAPDATVERAPRWRPRPAPGVLEFLADGAVVGLKFSVSALRAAGEGLLHPVEAGSRALDTAAAGWQSLEAGFTPPAKTPLNRPIGRQRRVEWRTLDLAGVRDVGKRLDGSVNDVVLSIVAGAVRSFLKRRRVKLKGLDFRVIVPVDTRSDEDDLSVANRVSAWFVSLPVAERSPLRRFGSIRAQTRRLKKTGAARGVDRFLRFADWSRSTRLPFWGVSLASAVRPYNLIVTNIHGPEVRLYLLGARLLEFYPQPPLFEDRGLAVAAMSYLGKIHFGLNGDWDLVPDLPVFADAIEASFAELREAAESG
jgi:WS/DGAT/MGAT family acyltransferase